VTGVPVHKYAQAAAIYLLTRNEEVTTNYALKMRDYLEKIAPMNNIDKIKKPMFVIAGKNDPRVPVSESQQIADALKKQGTPVWLLIAKDEGHGYRKKSNQDFQFYATVEFLQEHLLK